MDREYLRSDVPDWLREPWTEKEEDEEDEQLP
jgi:hypothetical protein